MGGERWGFEGWGFAGWGAQPRKSGAQKGGAQKGWSPEGWEAQNFALFFPVPPQNSFFSSLSGGLLVEFRLEFSGCCVKHRRPGHTEAHTNIHKHSQTHTNTHTHTQQTHTHTTHTTKSAKFWAPHPSGPHPSGPHPSGPHPSGPHFFLRSWRKCASGGVSKRATTTSYWWSRTTSAEEGATPSKPGAQRLSRRDNAKDLAAAHASSVDHLLIHALLIASLKSSGSSRTFASASKWRKSEGLSRPPTAHFTRNHHQTRPSVSLGQFGIGALFPCASLGHSSSIPGCALPPRRSVSAHRRHHCGVDRELSAVELGGDRLPLLPTGGCRHRLWVANPSPELARLLSLSPPASLHTRAAALSMEKPLRPKTPACGQAARWWPLGSSGRPHRQLDADRGQRGTRDRLRSNTRNSTSRSRRRDAFERDTCQRPALGTKECLLTRVQTRPHHCCAELCFNVKCRTSLPSPAGNPRHRVVQSNLPRLETPGDVPPLWTVEPTREEQLPAMGRCSNMWTSITALQGHAQTGRRWKDAAPGLWAMHRAQLAQYALTLSLEARRNPSPPFAKDIPALSIISCVLGMSNNWRTQFHTEVSVCSRKSIGPRRVDNPQQVVRPGRCAKEQEEPRTLQIAHCHDPAEKGGVFFVRGKDPRPQHGHRVPKECPTRGFPALLSATTVHPSTRLPGERLSSLHPRYARNQRRTHLHGSTIASSPD